MKQGWEIKHLSEVCAFQNGFAFKSKTFKDTGVPVLRISNIQKDEIDLNKIVFIDPTDYKEDLSQYKIVKDDLLIAMSGATTGKIGFNQTDDMFYLNQRVGKFEPKKELDKSYLYYFLSTKVEESLKISAGSAQPNLSTQQIKSFELPLPPLDEQKRIVSKLYQCFEAIDKARANVERNRQNAKELFQSQLNQIFSQKGEGWVEKKLRDVCIVDRGSSPRPIKDYITENKDGVNWIKIGDTKNVEKYIYSTKQKITKEGAKKSRFVDIGDFILTNSMTYGKPFIMKTKGFIHDGWFVLRLHDNINTEYFWYLLVSPYVKNQFEYLAAGAIVKNISGDLVKRAMLPIPSIAEQKRIVVELDNLSAKTKSLESHYQQELDALDELKKSILQKAFNGEL